MSSPRPSPSQKRKVCVFTGTRAEYGLLRPLIAKLTTAETVEASLLVTGAHLSGAHGATLKEIDTSGLAHLEKVSILDGDESPLGIASAMSRGLEGFANAFHRLRPDILVILGDRYEALAAAVAATVCHVPIAHLHGGELSFGAMDDVFRHSITKMSHFHFASTEPYRQRIIAMGEHPDQVFNVGALGVENALSMPLLDAGEVRTRLGLNAQQRFALLTYHPVTLDSPVEPERQVADILSALRIDPDLAVVATGANADAGGALINAALSAAAAQEPNRVIFRMSLGSLLYLSALKTCSLVIGNSSSGVIEAPSFGVPVIDIGSRQGGRIKASNTVNCMPEPADLATAVRLAISPDFRESAAGCHNPYEKKGTSETMLRIICNRPLEGVLLKRFHDRGV